MGKTTLIIRILRREKAMIKNKFLSKDYNEELADIIEKKGFSEEAENLL